VVLMLEDPLPGDDIGTGGRGTRRQVSLSMRAWNSSAIAARQLGSASPLR
jgi:hypothetical protein